MSGEYLTSNCLRPSSYSADPASSRLHLPIATFKASSNVILFASYSLGWIDNAHLKASLALNQPYFRRTIWHILALISPN
jgi:hypothetical protein